MSTSSLLNKSVALLACSGFEEQPFVKLQQELVATGAKVKVISRDSGLTNGWAGSNWGLSYPVDAQLAETLAIDYDVMVIPDGTRHTEMLLNDAHGKRIVNAFIRENVPSLVIGSAVDSLISNDLLEDDKIASEAPMLDKTLVIASAEADTSSMIELLAQAVELNKTVEAAA